MDFVATASEFQFESRTAQRRPTNSTLIMISTNSTRAWLPLLLAAAACLAGCGRSANPADSAAAGGHPLLKVTFQLDWYPAAEHGGNYEALVKNYYREAGLDVTIAAGGPGSHPVEMVATGRTEFAMGTCNDAILAVRQGLPILIICAQMEHDPQAIMVHAESKVRSFKDLAGLSVMAVPSANWPAFVQARYGIKFNLIPMDYGMARFAADKDFVQQCFISNEPYFAELHGIKTRAFLIASGGYDPYRVIFTSQAFARSHPEAVRGFVAATIRGYTEFLHGDASQARARIQADNSSQTPDLIDYSIATLKKYQLVEGDPAKGERIGLITPERMRSMVQTLVDLKVLDTTMPLDSFVSFDFLPPAPVPAAK
jgi:NitT/TauT family transport system substrate-binding protein